MIGLAHDGQRLHRGAPLEFDFMDLAIQMDPDRNIFGQGIDDGGADAMQTAGYLVSATAELAAGMQDGVNDLYTGDARLGLDIDRDTTAIVDDRDGVVRIDGNLDFGAVAGQSLVHSVVDDFIDQVMQTGGGGAADVHTRTASDRFQTFQDLDTVGRRVFFGNGHIAQLLTMVILRGFHSDGAIRRRGGGDQFPGLKVLSGEFFLELRIHSFFCMICH